MQRDAMQRDAMQRDAMQRDAMQRDAMRGCLSACGAFEQAAVAFRELAQGLREVSHPLLPNELGIRGCLRAWSFVEQLQSTVFKASAEPVTMTPVPTKLCAGVSRNHRQPVRKRYTRLKAR